jgi:cell division protein FtsW (lipid II flippase)
MMDALLNLAPVLPAATALRWALPVFWCVLLVWLMVDGLGVTRRWPKPVGAWVAAGVAVWTLVPADWSLAYGLGQAFQMPSVMAVLLCAAALADHLAWPKVSRDGDDSTNQAPCITLLWLAAALGWLLLLDTLALLPVHLYAWGHGTAALFVLALFAAVFWAWAGNTVQGVAPLAALTVYVLLRLPTGNVFDALLDPWLWVWAQFSLLRRCGPWVARRFAAKSTRG